MKQTDADRISEDFEHAADDHGILIIGSGYGGAVAASRLARAGQKVTVLERGREVRPGQYPKDVVNGLSEFQTTLSHDGKTYGKDYGLYDIRVGDDVNVFVGCGLGGTSLINANVAIEADPRALKNWPAPYNKDPDALTPYYARARQWLGSNKYPEAGEPLPKLDALEKAAQGLGGKFDRVDINVSFEDGPNYAGEWQNACNNCGDCVSGCNYGAKNTVLMNYLPDAHKSGAKLYTGADVQNIARDGTRWRVTVKDTVNGEMRTLSADTVILSAGTLGSTEILMRSQNDTLKFSKTLGTRFSTNGDIWAFGYNSNIPENPDDCDDKRRKHTYCVGAGDVDLNTSIVHPSRRPGPCITGIIDFRDDDKPLDECMIIEEGAMPGALAPIYAGLYPMINALGGDRFRFGDVQQRMEDILELGETVLADPKKLGDTAYTGPVSRTLPYLVMNHDQSAGKLKMKHGRIKVDWPHAGKDPAFAKSSAMLKKASDRIQAEYMPMPMWEDAFNNRVTCVHPLGGCPMGETAETGVVNADCQVFDPNGDLYTGLYVCDGAVLPSAVGVNPHLTITAIAERAMEQMIAQQHWDGFDLTPHRPDGPPFKTVETDPIKTLRLFTNTLVNIRQDIKDGKDVEDSLELCWGLAYSLYEKKFDEKVKEQFPLPTAKAFIDYAGDFERQRSVVLPIIIQLTDLLEPLTTALEKGALQDALKLVEEHMGDFSPPMWFPEEMKGHVSTIGIHDADLHAPYEAAAKGGANFTFAADISAKKIRTAIADDGDFPMIKGTAIWADEAFSPNSEPRTYDIDGTFKYLLHNPDEIECWNMVYEGVMTNTADPAEIYTYKGTKTLQLREGSHFWPDLTELAFDIFKDGEIYARGVIKIGLEDVITQGNKLTIAYTDDGLHDALKLAYDTLRDAIKNEPREDLGKFTAQIPWRELLMQGGFYLADHYPAEHFEKNGHPSDKIGQLYKALTIGKMGVLTLRTYGGFLSYMANFQAAADPKAESHFILPPPQIYRPEPAPGIKLKLTRYQGGKKGPVVLAAGFGALASTFATPTVEKNLVQMLVGDGFDVWLFDYRGSGDLPASLGEFDLDTVATEDWPAAIDTILANTDDNVKDVQVIVHCVGSLVFFMAMLAGETRIRSLISSQLGPHTIINWFKYAQADADVSTYVSEGLPEPMWPLIEMMKLDPEIEKVFKTGMKVVNPRAPSITPVLTPDLPPTKLDALIDTVVWNVPSFSPVPCNSPTCHRINFFFGPTYQHEQLNQATHDGIKDMFGPLSSAPYPHIAACFAKGHAISNSKDIDYMAGVENLKIPINFIVGAKNPLMLPECSLRTLDWLKKSNPKHADGYHRKVYQGYGHIDCFIGKNAHIDIFPDILEWLNENSQPKAKG